MPGRRRGRGPGPGPGRRPAARRTRRRVTRTRRRRRRRRIVVGGALLVGAGAMVANHSSWLDIFALNAAKRLYFVSKSEVAGWPVIGWLARATGTVFIKRKQRDAMRHIEVLRDRFLAGHTLLFFPEGTSTDGLRISLGHIVCKCIWLVTYGPVHCLAYQAKRNFQRTPTVRRHGNSGRLYHILGILS